MEMINIHDAKTHFSKRLPRVQSGEEIIISRAGKPCARLVPLEKIPLASTDRALDRFPIELIRS